MQVEVVSCNNKAYRKWVGEKTRHNIRKTHDKYYLQLGDTYPPEITDLRRGTTPRSISTRDFEKYYRRLLTQDCEEKRNLRIISILLDKHNSYRESDVIVWEGDDPIAVVEVKTHIQYRCTCAKVYQQLVVRKWLLDKCAPHPIKGVGIVVDRQTYLSQRHQQGVRTILENALKSDSDVISIYRVSAFR